MHYSVALAAALVAGASAAPHPKRAQTFSVQQVKNANYASDGEGVAKANKAYAKWHSKVGTTKFGKTLAEDDGGSGSVTATPSDGGSGDGSDEEYLCPVQINGQTFNLDFDTGSSDLWVFGSGVASGHTSFQPSGSDDQPVSGETWNISYGDGSGASGDVYSESVTVGGLTVTSQAVEVATSASSQFTSGTNDGLLGLAFSNINTVQTNGQSTPQNTFFQNAIDQGIISQPVVGVTLKHKQPGSYDFGAVDSSYQVAYTPVDNSQGFWGFTPDSYSVSGQQGSTQSSLAGIADTGTTLMLVPDDVASTYYANTGAQQDQSNGGYYTFPCSTTLPDFDLSVGGTTITIPGDYINFDTVSSGSDTCLGGIQSSDSIGQNIYGDIFLKSAYVVFDATSGSPQLGVAQQQGVSKK